VDGAVSLVIGVLVLTDIVQSRYRRKLLAQRGLTRDAHV
jgi:hypothetical protein